MEFKQAELGNGLTVIAEQMEQARSMALGFFVRTGGRDEEAAVSGVSHFLEHMMFKGTKKRSPLEVNLEFDRMGAKYNAFTSEENTVYYAAVLPEYQERVLALWADLMRPALREEDFQTEKGVILEEIAMYKDLPHFDVLDRCRRIHFGEHRCGNSVLGTVASIKGLEAEQMRSYFESRYAPDNMVLACTGKVDWAKLLGQAEELCGQWQPQKAERELSDFRGTHNRECVTKDNILREHICLMSGAPSAQDERHYAASILANIVGDDTGSRLYWSLVDAALADNADMEYDSMDGTGVYYTYISCDPKQADSVLEVTRETLAKVGKEGITEKELTASKNKIASTMTLNGELPMGRLVPLGFNWIYENKYITLAEELEKLHKVDRKDIMDLLDGYPLEKATVLGLGPCTEIGGKAFS